MHLRQGTALVGKRQDAQAALRAWMRLNIGRGKGKRLGKGLAAKLGLHPSQVTAMLRPGGRDIKAHEMPVICEYLGQEPPAEALSGAFTQETTELPAGARAMTPARVKVRIVGTNAPGMWRSQDVEPTQGAVTLMDDPDPRLEGLEQYGVWLEPGRSYAICVDYFEIRKKPIHGDEVFVRRINSSGQMEETIRRVEIARGGKIRLVLNGTVPRGVDRAVAYPGDDPTEKIEIVGFVVGTYTKKQF